jgi:hypothetical protein
LAQARTARRRHEAQTTADRERRITESFAKAVEQLGSDKLVARLGGIYTLERISREEREYWPIMETLTAYVRERAQDSTAGEKAGESTAAEKPGKEAEQASSQVRPDTDIQAILTVLEGGPLRGARLEGVNLAGARMKGAFPEAHLEGAWLAGAHLDGAVGLTQSAVGDDRTILPEGLTRPAHWPAATLNAAAG